MGHGSVLPAATGMRVCTTRSDRASFRAPLFAIYYESRVTSKREKTLNFDVSLRPL